ncbi:ABC transporter permease [Martelella mediterranea]|uniref:ABC transporter permease n=1 Tax=Martelella mediterranea TaxID=293089 RepID=UPI00037C3BA6|nr:iron ABC transporter permease [Martelella mediterranea]
MSFLSLVWIVLLAVLVIPPIVILIQMSFSDFAPNGAREGFTLSHYIALADKGFFTALLNSVIFSALATLLSLLIGGVLAWLVERTNSPFKGLAYLTAVVSLGTPYVLYVMSWLYILGRAGPLNSLYRAVTGETGVLFNVYSLSGMILIEGFLWSPLVFLLMSATFRMANAEMEEAARMNGASVVDTIWHVTLKLAWPAILALGLFVFIRNIESFEVPALVGIPGEVKVLTTDIYLSVKDFPPDLGHAASFSVIMLILVAVLLYFYGRISRHADRYASITGKGFRPRPFDLGPGRWIAGAIIIVDFVLVLALPVLALLWMALTPFVTQMRLSMVPNLTLENFSAVLRSPHYLDLAFNTLVVSVAAATGAIVITMVSGWLAARRKPMGGLVDQLTTMPLIFPGIVLGVALLELSLESPFPLYGTIWLIALAYLIRYLPYGMRYSYSGVLQIHRELEEASNVAGASIFQSLRMIVAPLLSPALMAGWLFIFLIASRELSIAVLLAGPRSQVIAVSMLDLWQNGQAGELSALGLLWTLLMVLVASAFRFVEKRQSASAFGGKP